MRRRNGDPAPRPLYAACAESTCPKCGTETEPFEISVEVLPLEELKLCPACYLVTWRDQEGFHVRQGLPVKKGANSAIEPDPPFYAQQKRPAFC